MAEALMTLTDNIKLSKLENYMKQAEVVAENSPDSETKVGALLVNPKTGAVLSSGYNGFVRGAADDMLPTTRPEKHKFIIHAEQNLLLNCNRHGIATDGCVMVCTLSCCRVCMRMAFQAGITTIYFKDEYKDFSEQIKMEDLGIILTKVGKYCRIDLEVK